MRNSLYSRPFGFVLETWNGSEQASFTVISKLQLYSKVQCKACLLGNTLTARLPAHPLAYIQTYFYLPFFNFPPKPFRKYTFSFQELNI